MPEGIPTHGGAPGAHSIPPLTSPISRRDPSTDPRREEGREGVPPPGARAPSLAAMWLVGALVAALCYFLPPTVPRPTVVGMGRAPVPRGRA